MKRLRRALVLACVFIVLVVEAAIAAPAGILVSQHDRGPCRRVDPIVSFGEQSEHEHTFYGVQGITATTRSSASLRALTSTWNRASNHSAFWTTCVYDHGVLMTPYSSKPLLAYYQFTSNTRQAPPEGTAGVSFEMGYRCDIGGGTVFDLPPASCSGNTLVLVGHMRGVRDLGLSGPTVFNIRVFIRLQRPRTGPLSITIGGPPGSSTVIPNGDIHFDYIWAHDRAKFQAFIDQCAPPRTPCGTDPAVLA